MKCETKGFEVVVNYVDSLDENQITRILWATKTFWTKMLHYFGSSMNE